ncbi:MAG: c-type cytochrome [Vicinamibacterales bacterium]|nr:c-type cytochrome [Vicinamibacterales bacterium]
MMRRFLAIVSVSMILVAAGALLAQQPAAPATGPIPWAYGFLPAAVPPPPPAAPAAQDDGSRKSLPGSTGSFTLTEIRNGFGPADWYPEDHPAMPEVVAKGRAKDVRACSLCHYPNGKGRAENASVNDLPVAYFIQQMQDFRNGTRKSAESRKANTNAMIAIAKAMTDDEIKQTAEYFAKVKMTSWVKVVEVKDVPKTRIAGGLFLKLDGSETEPLGQRIIEVPENTERTEMFRDPRSGFIAYAPVGSVKKGEALVTHGGGKTTACAICHGADLKGLGPVPGLAGRSPSYLVRQMWDMKVGARNGVWADLMKPVLAKLTEEDLLNISAYTASRPLN